MEEVCADSVCRQCGKPLGEKSAGRKRIYCSDKCRRLWVKNHPSLYKHECMFCGKEFESQTKNQKFCRSVWMGLRFSKRGKKRSVG